MKKKRLSLAKAKTMLKDDSAQGHPLTAKQKKLFQAVAHGFKPIKVAARQPKKRAAQAMPALPQPPYFQTAKGQSNAPGGLINPMKAKRKLQRAMKGYKK